MPSAYSTNALSRYCTAYRLGAVHDIIAASTTANSAAIAPKTADGNSSPMLEWSLEERRWCAYLHWATCTVLGVKAHVGDEDAAVVLMGGDAGAEESIGVTAVNDITRHILSFLEVTPKSTHAVKLRSAKRTRSGTDGAEVSNTEDDEKEANTNTNTNTNARRQLRQKHKANGVSKSDLSSGDDTLMPYFFVSPPYTDAVALFVRMSSPVTLTDEELNHFFGRYGMISARRVGVASGGNMRATGRLSTVLTDAEGGASPSGPLNANDTANASAASSSSISNEQHAHLQNFIVTLDVNRNCLRAIQELRHAEIVLIAFHKADRNVYCVADLPSAPSRVETLLRSVVPYVPGTENFSHVAASLRLAQGTSFLEADGHDGSNRASTDLSLTGNLTFVPDLVVDHLPYWTTREQIGERFAHHGTVRKLKLSVDDRNGSFMGTALVTMGTLQEAVVASEALNGAEISDGWAMTVGVLTESLDIVSLKTGAIICECEDAASVGFMMGRNVLDQRRVWV